MSLTADHVKTICKPGQQGATCSFLSVQGGGFACAKGTPVESFIRQRLAEGTLKAKGDNCDGETGSVPTNEVEL
jgi:hypothetical protein